MIQPIIPGLPSPLTPIRPTLARQAEEAAGLLLIRFAVLTGLLIGLARTWADPDLWGHVRFGADILRDGLTRVDPYSFTSDVPWVNHEWLAEVLMAIAWSAGGGGLIALKIALVGGTLLLLVLALRGEAVAPTARDLAAVIVLLGLWPRAFVIRPQLFSILLFAALLWALGGADRGRPKRLYVVPVLFALWVNLHGGWIVGLGALWLWAAIGVAGWGAGPVARPVLAGVVALSTAATLANPYGIGLWTFLGQTVRVSRPNIADWRPLFESGAQAIVPWLISAGFAAVAFVRGRGRIPPARAALVVGLAAASLRVNRLDAFFTLSTAMWLAPYVSEPGLAAPRPSWTRRTALAALLLVAILAGVAWRTGDDLTCPRLDGPWMPDRQSAAFIIGNRLEGRLLTWFDWGQYAIWHFSPALKVSLDGRRETVYSDAFVARHLQLYFTPDTSLDVLGELDANYAWLPRELALTTTLERRGWRALYESPVSVVLSREPASQPMVVPTVPARACFPGP